MLLGRGSCAITPIINEFTQLLSATAWPDTQKYLTSRRFREAEGEWKVLVTMATRIRPKICRYFNNNNDNDNNNNNNNNNTHVIIIFILYHTVSNRAYLLLTHPLSNCAYLLLTCPPCFFRSPLWKSRGGGFPLSEKFLEASLQMSNISTSLLVSALAHGHSTAWESMEIV